jgi:hypothetical protein
MTTRTSVDYIIAEVRRLTGAGTAEFTVDAQSYFSDEQIERILDSRRARLSRHEVVFEPELSEGGGTSVYKNARIGYAWVEDNSSTADFKLTDSKGSIIGTANYTLSAEDGFITFSADQQGSSRYVTTWVHNPYSAAVDILTSWNSELARQPDFATDNMRVWRSQKQKAIKDQIDELKELAGMAPRVKTMTMHRSDIKVDW